MRFLATLFASAALLAQTPDPRHLSNGSIIPDEGYSDQPYIVKTNDGAWLWYSRDSVNPRWFYNFQTQAWEAH